jgi:spermidine/putrescine transport system substrate-binding protein
MRAQRHRRSGPPFPAARREPTRRAVLAALAALATGAGSGVAGCGRRDADLLDADLPDAALPATGTPTAARARPLLWAGRPGGLDARPGAPPVHPSLVAFRRRTGIDVRYLPEAQPEADDHVWGSLSAALTRGEPCERDLVVLGDAGTARVVAAGWAEPLDQGALPGLAAVLPALRQTAADPGRRFSVPWRSAYTGLVWDTSRVDEPVAAVDDLWRADVRGGVVLPRDWHDGLAVLAMAAGSRVDGPPAQVQQGLRDALGAVERRLRHGHLLGVGDPVEALLRGRALAGLARSTDVQRLQAHAPGRFSFVVPDTGALLVTDSVVIPRGTARRADVLRLLDHYLQPAVAAAVCVSVPGLCPVVGAREVMQTLDARRAASPLLFPTEADLDRCQALLPQDDVDEAGYAQAYARLTGP